MTQAIPIAMGIKGFETFDPAEKAGLSHDQKNRLEQVLIASHALKDGRGLRIISPIDWWIAAQLTAALYNVDGSAKTIEETFAHDLDVKN